VLSKEIDVNAPRAFASAMAEVTQRVTPIINENVRQLIVTHHKTKVASRVSYFQAADLRTALAVMGHPTEVGFDTSNELARRLIESNEATRRSIAGELMIAVAGPVRQTVRVFVMRALLLAAASRTTTDCLLRFSSKNAIEHFQTPSNSGAESGFVYLSPIIT